MARVRDWYLEHPPSAWVRFLEVAVRLLNILLLLTGLAVFAWSIVTIIQIQTEPPNTPGPPLPPSPSSGPPGTSVLQTSDDVLQGHLVLQRPIGVVVAPAVTSPPFIPNNVPWFIYVFGALGAVTAFTAGLALLATRLRSPGCMSSHVFFMCLLLTGQACAAVAFFIDAGWERRLPYIDEKLKQFLFRRLQVCKWVGVGIFLLQLLTLLLSCWLQGAYQSADEAAHDADEEAAYRRRPLLSETSAGRRSEVPSRRGSGSSPLVSPAGRHKSGTGLLASPVAGGSGAAGATVGTGEDWSRRMQQQYGLDTTQFTYRPSGAAVGAAAQQQGGDVYRSSRNCVMM
eukprot:GHRR01007894.1.p1 GENE.GHRR01007894.1~~GHRR01007894.1.p1  ORF type:complete len:342 (+),score=98.59 GHRR01007894.1:229-1254(+)